MIEPPLLHSRDRKLYDLKDLEVLAKDVVRLGLHSQKRVQDLFLSCLDKSGTKDFPVTFLRVKELLQSWKTSWTRGLVYADGFDSPILESQEDHSLVNILSEDLFDFPSIPVLSQPLVGKIAHLPL